ncbi:MAG: TRAP transporter substrate-binding protein DctP, partial [Rhodoferax sp.]
AAGSTRAADPPTPLVFRISTENTASHVQTRVVQRFADALARRSQGRLTVEFKHSAQLFRDQDVIRALHEGKVDMAVPGTWQLDRYDPYVSVLMLPMFFGLEATDHHRVRDGLVGQLISAHLQEALQMVVPGRWIDLGHAHFYATGQAVAGYPDMAGLRIRIAGGAAIAAQMVAVGAVPVVVAWPDLPASLQRGRLDGLLTTHETIASAKLWQQGIRNATEIKAYFAQYIPLISRSCWSQLPEDVRMMVQESWESGVNAARLEAAQAQGDARRTLQAQGIKVLQPSKEAMQAWRHRGLAAQAQIAQQLGVPATLVNQAQQALAQKP